MRPLALLVLVACAPHDPPVVFVTGAQDVGLAAVEGWGALGFVGTLDDPKLPECSRTWYSDTFGSECQITIDVHIEPYLSHDCSCLVLGHADTDTRRVSVSPQLVGDAQHHTALHEVGHILLDSLHLESYINPPWQPVGVMQASGSHDLTPTVNDYELACYTIGVCI